MVNKMPKTYTKMGLVLLTSPFALGSDIAGGTLIIPQK